MSLQALYITKFMAAGALPYTLLKELVNDTLDLLDLGERAQQLNRGIGEEKESDDYMRITRGEG